MAEIKPVEKSAVASTTIWSGVASILGGLIVALPDLAAQVAPILSPHGAGIVVASAGIITILSRLFKPGVPITSVLPK